jgi:hypothetical protein
VIRLRMICPRVAVFARIRIGRRRQHPFETGSDQLARL